MWPSTHHPRSDLNVAILLRKCAQSRYVLRDPSGYLRYLIGGADRRLVRAELALAYQKALAAHYSQEDAPLLFGPALKDLVLSVNQAEDRKKTAVEGE